MNAPARQILLLVLLIYLISICPRNCRADGLDPATTEISTLFTDLGPNGPYPRGLRLVTLCGGFAEQPTGEREQLSFCTAGLNYYFADNWAFGIEAKGLWADQNDHDSDAGGADILLRTHLVNYRDFSFFGDFSAGVLEAQSSALSPSLITNRAFSFATGFANPASSTDFSTSPKSLYASGASSLGYIAGNCSGYHADPIP
jgi:hypothetical protein